MAELHVASIEMNKAGGPHVSVVKSLSVLQPQFGQQIGPCLSKHISPEPLRALSLQMELNKLHYKKMKFMAVYLCDEHSHLHHCTT